MAVLVDPPMWPAHGRLWSHLVSDTSLSELHEFARAAGVPARGFEGDHYDVPQERYAEVVAAGAEPVGPRELLARLQASGLRVPKRRGDRVVLSSPVGVRRVDAVLSSAPPRTATRTHLAARGGLLLGVLGVAQPWPQLGFVRVVDPPARELSAQVVLAAPQDADPALWTPVPVQDADPAVLALLAAAADDARAAAEREAGRTMSRPTTNRPGHRPQGCGGAR